MAGRVQQPRRTLEQLVADFHAKVDTSAGTDGCWPWLAGRSMGYGCCAWDVAGRRKSLRAHRIAYLLANGGDLPNWGEKRLVRHLCNNRLCCNPQHLRAGTIAENVADMIAVGDHDHGEGHHNAKLSEEDVRAMRAARREGETLRALATRFSVAKSTVSGICRNHHWRHLT